MPPRTSHPGLIVPGTVVPGAQPLLDWYDRYRRTMPWRARPGQTTDPYCVWLSEIMLQQTTVAAVDGFYRRFLARFPTVAALAAAPVEHVMEAWAGLGYYARARNLHACARAVVAAGGAFPSDVAVLRALPGIGPYTAAAIASIAFGHPVVPVDGNVERVAARVFAIDDPLPAARPRIAALAQRLGDQPPAQARPADFTQALFDLGATICTPRNPTCILCPWHDPCAARAQTLTHGAPDRLPRKAPKPERPTRHGAQFWLQDATGAVLLRRRPPGGLLGGMLELPGTPWRPEPWPEPAALRLAPQPGPWRSKGAVAHVFTHFQLQLEVFAATVPTFQAQGEAWPEADLPRAALPTVMRKCVAAAAGSPRVKPRPA